MNRHFFCINMIYFMTTQTLQKIVEGLGVSLDELFKVEYLKPPKELIYDIHSIIDSVKDDRDKVEEIYKILKAITSI